MSNSDFNETLCTCSLHKEMNLENISCGQKMFEIPFCIKCEIQLFPLYLENYSRYKKLFYTKVLLQNDLYLFTSINSFFKLKKSFSFFKNIIDMDKQK